jgi:hypothetical protein
MLYVALQRGYPPHRKTRRKRMNRTSFFKEHRKPEGTHRDIWVLSRLAVAGGAALTLLTFGVILG